MKLKLTAFSLVVLPLTACEPQPASRPPVAEGSLSLPLTSETRTELAAELSQVQAKGQGVCSASDLEFSRISVTLYAVASDEQATAPWTAAERAEVAKLRQRWDALGGDSRDISERCSSAIQAD